MFKIFREDFVLKLLLVLNDKSITLICPMDYLCIRLVLQDAIRFYNEVRDL